MLERFGSAEQAWSAGPAGWTEAGLRPDSLAFLASPPWDQVEAELEWAAETDNHILTWVDEAYPRLLRETSGAPPVLYVRGAVECLAMPQLAVVGSRNPTPGGRDNAYRFARTLAASGLCITSGLALGIDTEAHRGALASGGLTIAVAGTGLDRVYPASNRDLAHRVVAQGALVSEFPLGSGVRRGNFPRRNRVMSGLSLGTLVVEATLRSGSLITARLAMEQGREVFAIPGSIHSPLAKGCHRLLRDGAKLVESAEDVLEELAPLVSVVMEGFVRSPEVPAADRSEPFDGPAGPDETDADYALLREAIGFDPLPVDSMVERTGLTAEAVSSMLLILELNGDIQALPGGLYCRCTKRS